MNKQYTLINRNGKVRQFFVRSVAELYQTIEGGKIVTPQDVALERVKAKLEQPELIAVLQRLACK